MLNINRYQVEVSNGLREGYDLKVLLLGLTEEAGEVVGIFKKAFRDKEMYDLAHVVEELGDVCWYVANICSNLGIGLEEVMKTNIHKHILRKDNIRSRVIGYRYDEFEQKEVPIFEEDLDDNSEYKKSLH